MVGYYNSKFYLTSLLLAWMDQGRATLWTSTESIDEQRVLLGIPSIMEV